MSDEDNNEDYKLMQPLDIPEAIIETEGTIFGVLIKAHKLTHVRENIYKSPGGRKYHLTKFGLEPAVLYSAHEETRKIQHELEDVSDKLVKARKEINKLKNKPETLAAEVTRLNQKVQNQAEVIKRYHEEQDEAMGVKATPKSHRTKNEKITLLRGQIKMKNIEIAQLKKEKADMKPPKVQQQRMPKKMVSKVTNNINAILSTPMSDSMKIQQIETILSSSEDTNPNL